MLCYVTLSPVVSRALFQLVFEKARALSRQTFDLTLMKMNLSHGYIYESRPAFV